MIASIVSVITLIFTLSSFYWLFARRGKLVSYEPQTYAASITRFNEELGLLICMPLVLEATGARSIVILDLRITFPNDPKLEKPLVWVTSRPRLQPLAGDQPTLPAVFPIPSRQAVQYFIEFGGPFPEFHEDKRDFHVQIEAKVGHDKKWHRLNDFPLRIGRVQGNQYLTYTNEPL